MRTEGTLSPESWDEAEQRYDSLGSVAQTVVREVAKAMEFGREEYGERVTGEVVETARQTLFAEQLAVSVGTNEEFEAWRESFDGDVRVAGSDNVDRVAWHAVPFADRAVAATFQNEPEAAVATLRRMAFNRIYREELCDP
ncbi:hypothetical protein HWV23_08270 [Natronomonas halophila]|uniref:DUF5809 family protein n=1 Tax=Natronomonas halophila TaxID=2747817 RepID=UPI0015B5F01A|nr:DUF5809 family protein [Natronomonas halophila]QLD85719.1 hypothetical protein HWV23_08270 [Natronomonas halophila]